MTIRREGSVFYPEGRIDSVSAPVFGKAVTDALEAEPGLAPVIDFENVSYISSAGLRVLFSLSSRIKGSLSVINTSPDVYETFEITGFTGLLNVRRRMRRLSVEGCEVIGRGGVGTVYRLDDETIVKVYRSSEALPAIVNEQKRAKQAFFRGVPTAISYDIVRVGECYGSVFEMVKARTLNDLYIHEPERRGELLDMYISFMRQVHGIVMAPEDDVPDARDSFRSCVNDLAGVLPSDISARLTALADAMPENRHMLHGDFHMKNVMVTQGEPLLIDMDTLCVGDPVFDLASVFVSYRAFSIDDPNNSMAFFGIPEADCSQIWEGALRRYMGDCGGEALDAARDKIMVAGFVRFLSLVALQGFGGEEFIKIRCEHTIEQLRELLDRVKTLTL